ncbi:MAG: ABC transporter permease subunit, partial [Geminicoccaceae bacterium]|nr:ABC transporter permease subunit [Geminicoccaceae bacterium]
MDIFETFFNLRVFQQALPLLLTGLWVTLLLGAASIVLGMAGGLLLALARLYARSPLRQLAIVYIDVFRAIPLLVLLVIVYYALPFVGIRLSPFLSAVTALSLVSSAYSAEIFRAGIEAVPQGQFEAARSLGL